MSIKFNPFTGNFDFVGNSAVVVPTYELVITDNAQWGSPSGGLYTIVIPASTHGHGTKPLIQCLEQNGASYILVTLAHKIDASGNVTIEVLETPDNRFFGKILIGE
jgi:hypothetical protein